MVTVMVINCYDWCVFVSSASLLFVVSYCSEKLCRKRLSGSDLSGLLYFLFFGFQLFCWSFSLVFFFLRGLFL